MASWLLRAQWTGREDSPVPDVAGRVAATLTAVAVAFPEASSWTQDDRFGVDALTVETSGPIEELVAGVTSATGVTRLHLQSGGELPWLFDLAAGAEGPATDQLTLHWSDESALADSERFAQVLRAVVSIWEPEWASIADTDLAAEAGIFRRGIPMIGWLTYVRGMVTGADGVDIDLVPFERGTLLQAPVSPAELSPVHICAAAALVGIMPEIS
ncbi:hypothetical protein OG394_00020 [Kribbella sp. NBC_01245]|uniref:hypothetical protein n=1 Tax=Kribbella sp. NBC_01245 TaxID=2903578 RepID=UPI002E2C3A38|nr:hypothetical protein [Kribbella sp. NBC_01245]